MFSSAAHNGAVRGLELDITHGVSSSVDPVLGNRLAALADGEGCFSIFKPSRKKPGYACRFTIKLRADDRPLLVRLRGETGLGSIYDATCQPTPGRANNPASQWHVETKADCAELADIFEVYPLWSRKQEESELWIAAVRYWNAPEFYEDWDGRSMRRYVDWAPIRELASQIKDSRRFVRAEG